jgi:hypothetical protein
MQEDQGNIARVCEAILNHLQRNPHAADTLDGVMNWWLPTQYHESTDARAVEQALERSVAQGAVRKTVLVDGTILYAGTAAQPDR